MTENPAIISKVEGRGLPLRGNDIDTDRIIPARFLRCVTFEGLGREVFRDERFAADESPLKHSFNDSNYEGAQILIVNRNFGCGSSREHAPQAIMRFGIKAIIGESFAEIFAGNCASLGVPVCSADEATITDLQAAIEQEPQTVLLLDLEKQELSFGSRVIGLQMNSSARASLLEGTWDTLQQLLMDEAAIEKVNRRLPSFSLATVSSG